jgi:hypothetical protein
MVKGLVLAAVVGGAVLVAAATGGIDELRSQLPDLRKPFNEVNDALKGAQDRERQWDNVVKRANSICARYPHGGLVLKPALPSKRGQYVRAIGIELDRERAIQSELDVLLPPANYERPYSLFLHNRRDALAALERVQRATREKNPANHVDAARVLTQKKRFIDHYAETVGMPACAF